MRSDEPSTSLRTPLDITYSNSINVVDLPYYILTRRISSEGWAVGVWQKGKLIAFDFGPLPSKEDAYKHADDWVRTPEGQKAIGS